MSLVELARRRRSALVALAVLLAAGGVFAVSRLPSSIFPSVTFPIVKVIADAGEVPAAHMMPAVTRPLEEAILRVPGIDRVRSVTSRGSTEITANFGWGTDMQAALQRVQAETERVRPDLPAGAHIDVEWMNTSVFPILGYALTSDTVSEADLRAHAEVVLKPALLRIPGVSQVQIQGGRRREFQVVLDERKLAARGLTPADVVDAIRRNHLVISAGLVEQNHELYLALVDGRVADLAELGALAVAPAKGPPVPLADLGALRVADEVSYVRTTADGKPAVLLNVLRQPSGDTVSIARGIDRLLREEPGLLPAGARWSTFYDQASFVAGSVAGVRDAIAIGISLAALVLFLFLRSVRTTLVAVLAVPLAVAVAGLGLAATGQTVNLMTLAGVAAALGLAADDAIVVVEGIHRAEQDGSPHPVRAALGDLWPAILGSSLSTVAVFVPFALLPGVTGAFFKPLALTMVLVLLASLVVSLVLVPLAGSGLPRAPASPPAAWRARLSAWYDRVTRAMLRRRWVAVSGALLLLFAALALYRTIGTEFLPAMDEGAIILDYWSPPGTSLTDTDAMLRQAEKVILSIPDVKGYSRRTGTQLGFFITEPNKGDYVINLKPRSGRRPVDEIIGDIRARLAVVEPALHTEFGQLLEDNIGDLTGGAPQPISIKLFGRDPEVLSRKAREVAAIVARVRGVVDSFDGIVVAGPSLEIRVDPLAAAREGLSTGTLQAAVAPALLGTVAGQIRSGDRLYDLRVLAPHRGPLGELLVRTGRGALLPLSTLAKVRTGAPESEIDRENLATYVAVTARLAGRDLGGTVAEIRSRVEAAHILPAGVTMRLGGQYEQQQASFRDLAYVLLAGLVLVGVITLLVSGDVRSALATVITSLAALAGSLAALRLTGMTLNVSSYVGAIMMTGIAAENAIFVVREAHLGAAAGLAWPEAWVRASSRRLRPVAMTVLASALALAPLAVGLGQGSQLMQPLAIAVIGGFALSGPLVLWLLPALAARGVER